MTEHAGRTPAELKRLLELDRAGAPYLVHREPDGTQVETALDGGRDRLSLGRDPACEIALPWDPGVSRLHAELEHVAGSWVVIDDGSRNGTWVGDERVTGRRRLSDGDVLRAGATQLRFRDPSAQPAEATVVEVPAQAPPELSTAQRRVLIALCRPFAGGNPHAVPATNRAIAEELVLSEDAIKTHLRTLFAKFGVGDLPQNVKRARVVELALRSGAITPRDLEPGAGP